MKRRGKRPGARARSAVKAGEAYICGGVRETTTLRTCVHASFRHFSSRSGKPEALYKERRAEAAKEKKMKLSAPYRRPSAQEAALGLKGMKYYSAS